MSRFRIKGLTGLTECGRCVRLKVEEVDIFDCCRPQIKVLDEE